MRWLAVEPSKRNRLECSASTFDFKPSAITYISPRDPEELPPRVTAVLLISTEASWRAGSYLAVRLFGLRGQVVSEQPYHVL
jgi:hypothetical protein